MSKLLNIFIILLFSLGFNQVALAEEHCGKMKHYKEKMAKMYGALALTDEQKQKIKMIKQKYKESRKALYMKYKDLRGKMRDLVKSGSMDQTQLSTVIQRKQEMVAEKIKLKLKMKQAIYQLLTPEQRMKMEKMREMMMSNGQES